MVPWCIARRQDIALELQGPGVRIVVPQCTGLVPPMQCTEQLGLRMAWRNTGLGLLCTGLELLSSVVRNIPLVVRASIAESWQETPWGGRPAEGLNIHRQQIAWEERCMFVVQPCKWSAVP